MMMILVGAAVVLVLIILIVLMITCCRGKNSTKTKIEGFESVQTANGADDGDSSAYGALKAVFEQFFSRGFLTPSPAP